MNTAEETQYIRLNYLVGKKFGKLRVLWCCGSNKYQTKIWKCACECGNLVEKSTGNLTAKKRSSWHCGCTEIKSPTGKENHAWTGYEEISGAFWDHVRKGATTRNLAFDISKEDVWEIFTKQNKKCALSGLPLTFGTNFRRNKKNKIETTASIDRIDSSIGYIKTNIQITHKYINMMKGVHSNKYFVELCSMVVKQHGVI